MTNNRISNKAFHSTDVTYTLTQINIIIIHTLAKLPSLTVTGLMED